jgi:hypothetical protein
MAYTAKIAELEKVPHEIWTVAMPPGPEQQREYWRKLADLLADPFYLFFLSENRRWAVDGFERSGKDNAEYYRGKLAQVHEFVEACRAAKVKYEQGAGVE